MLKAVKGNGKWKKDFIFLTSKLWNIEKIKRSTYTSPRGTRNEEPILNNPTLKDSWGIQQLRPQSNEYNKLKGEIFNLGKVEKLKMKEVHTE